METISHGHIDPNDIVIGAFSWHQTHPVSIVWIPLEWEAVGSEHIEVYSYRLVVDDHVFFGQRHVVHHRHPGHRHINGLADFAVGAHHHILHMIHPLWPRIHHGMHFPRHWVNFGVSGKRAGERAFKVVSTNSFQLVGKLHWRAAGLYHCPGFARKTAHIGIWTTR